MLTGNKLPVPPFSSPRQPSVLQEIRKLTHPARRLAEHSERESDLGANPEHLRKRVGVNLGNLE